ncbi:MAG: phosphonate ABC transporter, permease protein PhnE [Candidatus Acetothermia bacterium]|jgi:phosphonate transport system permease protein|nr:phosphonate ABC transporter, permease protein PhnE [Candidatus Acetothermia bacterium]
MTGYPDGFVSPQPAWATRRGLTDAVGRRAEAAWRHLSVFLLDAAGLATLWILVTYAYAWYVLGTTAYALVPWWVFGVGVGAGVWEGFGRSWGQKALGRQLRPQAGEATLDKRFLYVLLWHLVGLTGVGFLFSPPLHERLSGLALERERPSGAPVPWYRTSAGLFVAALLAVTLLAGLGVTLTWDSLRRLFTQAGQAVDFWYALVRPDTSILLDAGRDMIVTVFMAVLATVFAVVVAVPLSFLAARNLMRGPIGRPIYTVIRGAMSIARSIEPVIWAIIFLVWVTALRSPFAGILALWVHSIADLVKLYAERLEAIDQGPIEAVTATGAGPLSVLRYAVVPQIVNPYISFTLYRWDINIRMATVVGLVGGGGIGQRLINYIWGVQYRQAGMVMILIVVLVWAIDYLSARLRAKLA